MAFEIRGRAELVSIALDKKGGDRNPYTVAKLTIVADGQTATPAAVALGVEDTHDLAAFHYPEYEDEHRSARFLSVAAIKSKLEQQNKHRLALAGFDVHVAKLANITVVPVASGRFAIGFAVTILDPPDRAVETWVQFLHSEIPVALTLIEDELPLAGGGGARAAQRLDDLCRESGTTATLSVGGEVLATFGGPLGDPDDEVEVDETPAAEVDE